MTTGMAASYILMFIVLPAWILAGLADYLCHRASNIERNAGFKESLLHMLQLSLVGIPILLGLFLEITRGLLVLMAAAILLHHTVAYWDVRYANSKRLVRPIEQMVHSFLELLPITAFLLLCAIHWPEIAGGGNLGLRPRALALPKPYVAGFLTMTLLLNVLPYAEELVRTWRNRRALSANGTPKPR